MVGHPGVPVRGPNSPLFSLPFRTYSRKLRCHRPSTIHLYRGQPVLRFVSITPNTDLLKIMPKRRGHFYVLPYLHLMKQTIEPDTKGSTV